MLIKGYTKSFVRPPNPRALHLRCFAALDVDVTAVLPYLNTVLQAFDYSAEPPTLTLKLPGKLVTIHPMAIAINIVKDQDEAEEILAWLTREINNTWARRGEIPPSFEVAPRPRVLDLIKLLPKTNCRECGAPTCMVFAIELSKGQKVPEQCPALNQHDQGQLQTYLRRFYLPWGQEARPTHRNRENYRQIEEDSL
jgi:ArsR family metal-binding transcriptional regulator